MASDRIFIVQETITPPESILSIHDGTEEMFRMAPDGTCIFNPKFKFSDIAIQFWTYMAGMNPLEVQRELDEARERIKELEDRLV